ncbi:hypothetical protein HYY72_00780 [Candidatus Woesearchaeota archaeon]|nr:hypothetical protein [Candidatus Woesearchaeota archaeon]
MQYYVKFAKEEVGVMVSRSRRGQAAMEFLMTYGWAILVVLVVIGALAYFGVLSPDTLLPEKCTMPLQVTCKDHRVDKTASTIKMVLLNGAGRDMKITTVKVDADTLPAIGCNITGGATGIVSGSVAPTDNAETLGNGQQSQYIVSNCTYTSKGRSKDRYKVTVTYSWLDSTSISHTLTGELLAKAET